MRSFIFYIGILLLATSCLKKIDGVDELNTNIFDRDYTGDKWFYIDDAYTFFNDVGLPRVRVEAILPGSNMPELKPYSVQIECWVNAQPATLINAVIDNDGNYLFYFDAIPETSGEYCLSAGIYVEAEETTINTFVECTDL